MQARQNVWTAADQSNHGATAFGRAAQLVLVFGNTGLLQNQEHLRAVRTAYPNACVLGCSTAGEIADTNVRDDTLVITAVHFDHTHVAAAEIDLADASDSFDAGQKLAKKIDPKGLIHVMVISDGLAVNGSELVKALSAALPQGVGISGGLSGDGARFQQTLICAAEGACARKVAVVGFYGDRIRIGCASMGGWDTFGPDRVVTRSRSNVLYELDGRSALGLYKEYLGEHAARLPASGLLFPLSVRSKSATDGLVRTILSVNEAEGSMTFAGDIPQGCYARLMRATFERLIDGAQGAAQAAQNPQAPHDADLAVLISCVGRKLVLKQRVEEEVEAVRNVLGPKPVLAGFYSYGEISPFTPQAKCELHNQTMAITTFCEQ